MGLSLMNKSIVLVCVLVFECNQTSGKLCLPADDQHTGTPYFTAKHSEYISVRYGHYAEFDCCAQGADEIIWYKFSNSSKTWEIFSPIYSEEDRVTFIENRHVLLIKRTVESDEGKYKCVPKKGSTTFTNLEHQYTLTIVQCDVLARGPYPIAPIACNPTFTKLGASLTLPCVGYFGCSDNGGDFSVVTWYVSRDNSGEDDWIDVTNYDKRYQQITFSTNNDAVVGANLTISEVTADDIHRKFMCLLASPQIIKGETKYIVQLRTHDLGSGMEVDSASTSVPVVIAVAAIVVASLLLLIILIAITLCSVHKTKMAKRLSIKHQMPSTNKDWTYIKTGDITHV